MPPRAGVLRDRMQNTPGSSRGRSCPIVSEAPQDLNLDPSLEEVEERAAGEVVASVQRHRLPFPQSIEAHSAADDTADAPSRGVQERVDLRVGVVGTEELDLDEAAEAAKTERGDGNESGSGPNV